MSKMFSLDRLAKLPRKFVIGLMSGTSADGIDAVLVELRGAGTRTTFRQIAFCSHPFPRGFKATLLRQSAVAGARIDMISRCDFLLGSLFADAARSVARKAGIPLGKVHLIGSHGQTIHHLPDPVPFYGKSVRATFQIGNISVIAKETGVVTVGNFRAGDVAAGGSGAPLVPYFDFITFRSRTQSRAALNLGGIANMTVLPANCTIEQISAFDTGPGNMIVDGLMRRFFSKELDRNGATASGGTILPGLLRRLMLHPYFKVRPPKSTGREMFGGTFIDNIAHPIGKADRADIITTLSEFTAMSIYDQYLRFVKKTTPIEELIVSGGGGHNRYIMDALERYFSGVRVTTSDAYAIDSDAKEALCFALLANETLTGNPSNVPGATGARKPAILGTIAFP